MERRHGHLTALCRNENWAALRRPSSWFQSVVGQVLVAIERNQTEQPQPKQGDRGGCGHRIDGA